jgi:hypothetical protein
MVYPIKLSIYVMGLLKSALSLLFIELDGVLQEYLEADPIGEYEDGQLLVQVVSDQGQCFTRQLNKDCLFGFRLMHYYLLFKLQWQVN